MEAVISIHPHPPEERELNRCRGRTGSLRHSDTWSRSERTWECTQVVFVSRDQKAFTFRCFPVMNIQWPY